MKNKIIVINKNLYLLVKRRISKTPKINKIKAILSPDKTIEIKEINKIRENMKFLFEYKK